MVGLRYNHVIFLINYILAHEFHEFTRKVFNEINGDLFGRTNFHEFIHIISVISATEQVAI